PDAGFQLHSVAEGPGPEDARRTDQTVRRGCHGWRPDHPGQALVLRDRPPGRVGEYSPRHVGQQERQRSELVGRGFRSQPASVYGYAGPARNRAPYVASIATPQAGRLLAGAAPLHRQGGGRYADPDARGQRLDEFQTVPHPTARLDVYDQQQAAGRGGNWDVPGSLRPEWRWRTAHRRYRRGQQPPCDPATGTKRETSQL